MNDERITRLAKDRRDERMRKFEGTIMPEILAKMFGDEIELAFRAGAAAGAAEERTRRPPEQSRDR